MDHASRKILVAVNLIIMVHNVNLQVASTYFPTQQQFAVDMVNVHPPTIALACLDTHPMIVLQQVAME